LTTFSSETFKLPVIKDFRKEIKDKNTGDYINKLLSLSYYPMLEGLKELFEDLSNPSTMSSE
jgi:hypothetical protein